MGHLLEISWWLGQSGPVWRWLLVCLLLTAAALPLTLRLFRGLPDRGASLAPGVGILGTAFLGWILAQEWFTGGTRAIVIRLALLCVAFLLFSISALWTARRELSAAEARRYHYPALVFLFAGLIALPHHFVGLAIAALLLAGASVAAWTGEWGQLRRSLRLAAVPGAVSLLLFLVGFLFFANVRSHIPWATFELSLWQAEKWGNYTHLHGVMRDRWMPADDLWFDGRPINYYYMGHVTTATMAKLSATPTPVAFNLGIATTFGLTLSLGFGFVLALVHLTTRRTGFQLGRWRVVWHSGMAWGLFGAATIGLFGNMDGWRQWLTRDMDWSVRQRWEWEQRRLQDDWKLGTGIPSAAALRAAAAVARSTPQAGYAAAIAELQGATAEMAEVPGLLESLLEEIRALPAEAGAGGQAMQLLESQRYRHALRQQTAANYELLMEEMDRLAWQDRTGEMAARLEAIVNGLGDPVEAIERTIEALRRAEERGSPTAQAVLERQWGGFPHTFPANPEASDIWRSWENFSFVRFWDSSRVIKGTPRNVAQAGTITEFPYFSAILGDHHPHHFAIPWTLLALAACVSFLRKGTRLVASSGVLLRRTWPDVLTMAFFIGAVFTVNSWDSVVLGPVYALVLLVGWLSVRDPEPQWRWAGFAGLLLLLCLGTALVWNSVPDMVPLFGRPLLLAGGVAMLALGLPLGKHLLPQVPWAGRLAALGAAALLLIAAGAVLAPKEGIQEPSMLRLMVRDALVFGALASLAALWTLKNPRPWHLRLYGWAGLFGGAGAASLFLIIPFQSYFNSPLLPARRLLESTLPPVPSPEVTQGGIPFWRAFWEASVINPFPANIRTYFGDFFMHWGIFMVPVLAFVIWRIMRPAAPRQPGVGFAVCMGALLLVALARNYLGYWVGALCLGAMVFAIVNAIEGRRKAEGPAWAFLAVAFFWCWFVEALHFDDDYAGSFERYNTVFKIYYPVWILFAGGMVVAVRELAGRGRIRLHRPSELLWQPGWWALLLVGGVVIPWTLSHLLPVRVSQLWFLVFWLPAGTLLVAGIVKWVEGPGAREGRILGAAASRLLYRWPAAACAGVLLVAGLYYPLAATVTRTREFGAWPMVGSAEARLPHADIHREHTLDALAHYRHFPAYHHDYFAMRWLAAEAPRDARLAEVPGDEAYGHAGRLATGGGVISIISWRHHQSQWRGRAKPAPMALKAAYYDEVRGLPNLTLAFREVVPELTGEISPQLQRSLRLSSDRARLRTLATNFPTLGRNDLYRLRRQVEKNDVTINMVTEAMLRHADDILATRDESLLRRLIGRYGITHLAIGEIEEEAYGAEVAAEFEALGFEMLYDSREDTDRHPGRPGTRIYAVPEGFGIPWEEAGP